MTRATVLTAALAALVASLAGLPAARADVSCASRLAVPALPAGDAPRLWLAQRTIDREWGPSEDSSYVTVDVPGWKSEGAALALSGVLPGAGQLYAGEGSGWWFLVGEAAGWFGNWNAARKARDLRDQAARFVGDPTDSTSTWSFTRYEERTGVNPATLEALWNGDRDAFYEALQRDGTYVQGFVGAQPDRVWANYVGIRDDSDNQFRVSRWFEVAVMLNHLYSSWDAMRAVRFHNLPLRQELQLKVGGRPGRPDMRVALVRRF